MSGRAEALASRARTQQDVQRAVDAMLEVLQAAESGDLAPRVEIEHEANDPLSILATCVNGMITYLAERRAETLRVQRELEGQLEMIQKQQVAIQELSTPIIEIWKGVLCAPIVGVLDSARASDMTNALLHSVVETKASLAIIDITGIEAMDTQATDHFLRMARAVRLLGSECALSGIHPNVARTITHMGVDLIGILSYRTLRDALQAHVTKRRTRPANSNGRLK